MQLTLQRSDELREGVLVAGPCGIHQFRLHSTHATTPRTQERDTSSKVAQPRRPADVENFLDDPGRQTHLSGPIAQRLMKRSDELVASPPNIEQLDLLASKLPS
ncbi:hypothetical protein GCM10009744_01320 [Kribbella alba]|uniref:Uncharacterized protein n=1 Tax=Kribbella alba TaxID=190197 RepID=A0ABN2EY60_9ACTN